MIQLDRVSKHFTTDSGVVRALDELSLQITDGQFAAVCGPSGCGKSTLLAMVGGLATPTSGKIVVGGNVISSMSSAERAAFRATNVGFVFQMFHLLPYLTVRENILVSARRDAKDSDPAYADELIKQFGLADRERHLPGQLSAGERQRTAMARAMLTRPDILLADEPTGNLDPRNAESVLDLIVEFHRQGGTVVLVTHDPAAAARAQVTIELEAGRLATQATR